MQGLPQVDRMQLEAIGRSVLEDFLKLSITAVTDGEVAPAGSGALVSISGAWQGVVEIRVGAVLADRITATMFRCPPDQVDADKLRDALDEIANIIGGNVKALLPAPSLLSMPSFLDANSQPPEVDVAVCLHDEHDSPLWIGVAALTTD
jgi:hypothetical protein